MNKDLIIISSLVPFALGIVFFTIEPLSNEAFGLEENFLTLQTGKISTQDRDFAVSNDFEIRVFKNGYMMRVSGVTTTGEPYYIYQKNVGDDISIKGKILLGGSFVPIIQKETTIEPVLETPIQVQEPIKMVIKQPHSSYWRQDYTINIKTFEADKNPSNDYWYKEYLVPHVPILVNITHENGKHLATIRGNTNEDGYFQGSHYLIENLALAGKYFVHVVAGDEKSGNTKDLTTFVIAEILGGRSDNKPKSLPTFNPPNPVPILTFVNLIGSNSYDPNGMIVTYFWEQTSGVPPVVIADPNAADTSFTTPAAPGTFKFRLTVTDNDGLMDAREITIIVI